MKLHSLEIENYKSIAEPVRIRFYTDLPTVLIGKNGSGKSNILEAIERIASTNFNLPGKYGADRLRYKAYMRLDKDEFTELFPKEVYSEEKATFFAYSSKENGLHIDTIESAFIVPLLKKEFEYTRSLTYKLQQALSDYEKTLEKLACEDGIESSLRRYSIERSDGAVLYYDHLKYSLLPFVEAVQRSIDSLPVKFDSANTFMLPDLLRPDTKLWISLNQQLIPFKLKYQKPILAPFEQKFITINETAIKGEITKINKKTEEERQTITELLNALDRQTKALFDDNQTCSALTKFLCKVKAIFGENCGYLLNESSQVLFRDLQRENANRHYYDPSHVIFEAYAKATGKEALLQEKEHKLNSDELKDFEEWLNANRPEFDQGMYKNIIASGNEKNNIAIYLEENNGQTVSLNESSAGRRWYFTYHFVKSTLGQGDTFIIDEPASMLHPIAQKEIMQDILNLSKQGVRVIYSTHNPYLIPKEWSCVHSVTMTSNGTEVSDVLSDQKLVSLLTEICGEDIFETQAVLEKYFLPSPDVIARNISDLIRLTQKERGIKNLHIVCDEIGIEYQTMKSWNCMPTDPKGKKNKKFNSPSKDNVIKVLRWAQKIKSIL